MSRTPPFRPPQRGGTFRPQLEALEDRLAPGSLLPWLDDWGDTRDLVAAVQAAAATQTTSPVVLFSDHSVVVGESTVMRTENGVTAHLTASGLAPGAYTFCIRVHPPRLAPPPAR